MTKEQALFQALCREVAISGIETERFTELWMATGVTLNDSEFEVANVILQRFDEQADYNHSRTIH